MVAGSHYIEEEKLTGVSTADQRPATGVSPISIDFADFQTLAMSNGVERRAEQLRQESAGRKIILGVDRLDYSKGIPLRLRAYRTFLERFENLHRRVSMTQIVVPIRDQIPEY